VKILIDTDILLDVALRRAEFFADSAAVLSWAEANPGQAAVAWHSLSNVAYLVKPDAAALSFGARQLVTRNLPDYRRSAVPALAPRAFLELVA
jgi:hypothetical protein